MARDLAVTTTPIPGLLVISLPLPGDERGWFKENWQRDKMTALGLPDFGPVQHSMSHNVTAGVTRGFHAEPWDKLVSVACGRAFGAWVDLRDGPTFGVSYTTEIGPDTAVFVPRGVGNSFQAIEDATTYSYLVNEHWSAEARARYSYLNLADETAAVAWPIPLAQATLSEADRHHPRLSDVTPAPRTRTIVTGANGQVGRALRALLPDAEFLTHDDLDITAPGEFDFDNVGLIVNAAAWTGVDSAEREQAACWAANVTGPANLVAIARRHRATLVHLSSDYVFDGSAEVHTEDEAPSPLGTYGASKAAGDAVVATWPRHYIVRTAWVVGDGRNFVDTMASLARRGVSPSVVDDQTGRLTFASEIARAIVHLTSSGAPFGTYNLTCAGPPQTWFDVATTVFGIVNADMDPSSRPHVEPTDTATYGAGKAMAPRPRHSVLDLAKIEATGFAPRRAAQMLAAHLR